MSVLYLDVLSLFLDRMFCCTVSLQTLFLGTNSLKQIADQQQIMILQNKNPMLNKDIIQHASFKTISFYK